MTDEALRGQTHGQHALCDSASDANIHRVDDHRRSVSPTSASCTQSRSDF